MLRELHRLLDELHDGLNAIEVHGGVRLSNVDMTLPLELRPVFRDGGCVLLADVPRQRGVDAWVASPSKLVIGWSTDGAGGSGRTDAVEGDGSAVRHARESSFDRHPRADGDPWTLAVAPQRLAHDANEASVSALDRHPRAGGDPVTFAFSDDADASTPETGSLGPRLRGDDETRATSMDPRLRGDDGLKGHRANDASPAVMHVERRS